MASHRCAVFGKPVAHPLSPVLHNAAYHSLKLDDWLYDRHGAEKDDLDAFPRSFDSTWAGLNPTISLKETIQPYDVPENSWAKELKVTNTAVFGWSVAADSPTRPNDKPSIKLYNTDVIGAQLVSDHANRELGEHHAVSKSDTTLTIGNGNTAVSALVACCTMPEIGRVTVVAYRPGKNTGLRPVTEKFINMHNPYNEIELDGDQALFKTARNATYVINMIPGHAADNVADALADAGIEPFSGLLLDVIYDPRPTKLMEAWCVHGGHTIGDEEMLLYRALVQVLLVTGIWDDDSPSDADQRLQDTITKDGQLEIVMRKAFEETL